MQATGVLVERGGRPILQDVSMALAPGQVVGILGANGAGKSTLLGVLAGEIRPAAGVVRLAGQPLQALGAAGLARRRAVLPQKPSLQFHLAVAEVVGMGAYPFPALTRAEVRHQVEHALALAEVAHLARRSYLALSGGEQQRVQFARALVQVLAALAPDGGEGAAARFLLLDEPTASLDPKHQQALLRVTHHLTRTHDIGAAVVLHDVNLASRWCDRLVLLQRGRLRAQGAPAQVLTVETLADIYEVAPTIHADAAGMGRPRVWFD